MTAIPMSSVSHQNSFSHEDLLTCARGEMFGPGNAQLPAPPSAAIWTMRSIISIGGAGSWALPGPNISPRAHDSRSS